MRHTRQQAVSVGALLPPAAAALAGFALAQGQKGRTINVQGR